MKPGAGAAVKFGLLPSVRLRRAPHIPSDLPSEEEARARQRLDALSALSLHPGEGRLASPTRTPSPRLGSSGASSLFSVPSPPPLTLDPSLHGAPRLPSPTRPPGPGSQGPACAPGALMSSRDSRRRLTWCLVRISRPDLSSGGISPARLVLPGAAPREGAERGRRR